MALISLGSVSSQWTLKELRKYFEKVDDIDLRQLEVVLGDESKVFYKGKEVKGYDCIYAKGSFRYNQVLRAATSLLSRESYMPIKASAFSVGHDKLLTHLKLVQNNIPMPQTYIATTPEAAKKILERLNYPIIMKFPEGTQGKGVLFADSYAAASSMLDALMALKQSFIIQEYIETDSTDLRVIVVGEKVVAIMKRNAMEGEKRANIHAGGIGEPYELTPQIEKIAVKAAKALGAEICAVDILESASKGPLVIEANLSPGLQGITKTTKVNVANEIAKYLYKKTKEIKEGEKTRGTKEIMKDINVAGGNGKKEIYSNLDFRGERILLPEFVTTLSKIKDEDEVVIKVENGKFSVERE